MNKGRLVWIKKTARVMGEGSDGVESMTNDGAM